MIMVFAHRNRDIKVDMVEYYNIDDSESESANPSQGSDQDQPEDPNDRDEQGHDEDIQDPEGDMADDHEESPNGQDGGPHESLTGSSTESHGIGDVSSSEEEETGSEWGHEDSTNSECSANKLKSILKRRSEHQAATMETCKRS